MGTNFSPSSNKCVGKVAFISWPQAILLVSKLNEEKFEGYGDWRLPARSDVANLLLTNRGFRKIISMQYHQYGLANPNWFAKYDNGDQINFGGYYGGDDRARVQCRLAGDVFFGVFGEVNGLGRYRDVEDEKVYNRWLADNYRWSKGGRISGDKNDWQNALSYGMHNGCSNVITAFYKESPDVNLARKYYVHAELPVQIVRGGEVPQEWIDALSSLSYVDKIYANSKKNSQADLESVVSVLAGVKSKAADALSNLRGGCFW